MDLIVGPQYDSGAWPDALAGRDAAEGVAVVGPLGLVSVLETRLGMAPQRHNQTHRIAQFQRGLKACDGRPEPFYSQSLKADAWSTARHLLAELDGLRMAGWDGSAETTGRLRELRDAARAAELSPGLAERIDAIGTRIADWGLGGLSSLTLETELRLWPSAWRRLFARLEEAGVRLIERDGALRGQGFPEGKSPVVRVLRTTSLEEAGELLASWLDTHPSPEDVVLLAESDGQSLDTALRRQGLPVTGQSARSAQRTALQLLPIGLALLWKPFSPSALIDLLTAPLSPIHPALARHLLDALTAHPGIGGPRWEKALARCAEWAAGRENGRDLLEEVAFWTGLSRHDQRSPVDAGAVTAVCGRLSDWAGRMAAPDRADVLAAVSAMAGEMAETLALTGMEAVTKAQLSRILDSVVGGGVKGPERAEAAPWAVVSRPGQVRGPVGTLVWWNFSETQPPRLFLPWTGDERATLERGGADLRDFDHARQMEVGSWKAPLRHAESVLLVLPDSVRGQAVAPHPLWDELTAALGEAVLEAGTIRAADVLLDPAPELLGCPLNLTDVRPGNPVAPLGDWRLPQGQTARRPRESPSGLINFLGCPLSWFLKYILRIRPGNLAEPPEGGQLYGNFCHRLVELLVEEKTDWTPSEARARADRLFDALVGQMAAPLNEPGREATLLVFREKALDAVECLFARIGKAGLSIHASEQENVRRDQAGQEFVGYVDLVLKDGHGAAIPWDMKWSGTSRHRREEMEQGRALQLAAYCWLLGGDGKDAAYFMLNQRELISTDAPWAEERESVAADLPGLWTEALAAYHAGQASLDAGTCRARGLDTPDEAPGLAGLTVNCGFCDYAVLCGREHAE